VHKRAGNELLLSDLPRRVVRRDGGTAAAPGSAGADGAVNAAEIARAIAERRFDLRKAVGELERSAVEAALAAAGGSAAAAARLLGRVGRGDAHDPGGTVRAMMRRLNISFSGTLSGFQTSRDGARRAKLAGSPRGAPGADVSSGPRRRSRKRPRRN